MNDSLLPDDLPENPTLSYKGTRRPAQPLSAGPGPSDDAPKTLAAGAGDELATLAGPAGSLPTEVAQRGDEEGYRLLRRVATGGMGEVWEAVQVSLGRVVAIKAVRSDRLRDSGSTAAAQLTEEFRREAVFAARLEHPNIIPVHDLGRDASGAPILAMKYVQGTPWDRALAKDLRELEPAALLGRHLPVLIAVSQAVAFAHSRGVVHRDLKPAQVMLGGFGEVLLIDWGLALFVGESEHLEETRRLGLPELEGRLTASNPSGTPALMAPEQTEPDAKKIGTWTDIYLLGGTLYYLLTGTFPHEDGTAHRAFARARSGVIDPPSKRAPDREIPSDLEALCLAALHPDPADRIPDAQQFIAALQDHLSGESKRRESRALAALARAEFTAGARDYSSFSACAARVEQALALWPGNPELPQLREDIHLNHAQLALRNGDLVLARLQAERLEGLGTGAEILDRVARAERTLLARTRTRRLAIAASFTLLGAIVIGGAFFTRQLAKSRDAEAAQRQAAVLQRDLARDARGKSDQLATFVLKDMTERLATLDRLDLLDPALERALVYYTTLPLDKVPADERVSAMEGLISVAQAGRSRGNSELQKAALEAAARLLSQLPPADAASPKWLALANARAQEEVSLWLRLGDAVRAEETGREIIRLAEKEVAAEPRSARAKYRLSTALAEQAHAATTRGKLDEGIQLATRALAIDEEVIASGSPDVTSLSRLVISLRHRLDAMNKAGRGEDARPTLDRVYAVIEEFEGRFADSPELISNFALALNAACDWHTANGSIRDGIRDNLRAADFQRRAMILAPATPLYESGLITSLSNTASLVDRTGDAEGALKLFQEAYATAEALTARDPKNIFWSRQRLAVTNNLALQLAEMNRNEEAAKLADEQFNRAADLYKLDPGTAEIARGYVIALQRRVGANLSAGRLDEAEKSARKSVEIADEVAARFPGEVAIQADRVVARTWLGGALSRLDRPQEALVVLDEARKLDEAEAERSPERRDVWDRLASIYSNIGLNHGTLRSSEEALKAQRQSASALRRLVALDQGRADAVVSLAQSLQRVSEQAISLGFTEEALEASAESIASIEASLARNPRTPTLHRIRATAAVQRSRVLADQGRETESLQMMLVAHEGLEGLLRYDDLGDSTRRRDADLVRSRIVLGEWLLGRTTEALEVARAALASRDLVSRPIPNDILLRGQLLDQKGRVLLDDGEVAQAVDLGTSATATLGALRKEQPSSRAFRSEHLTVMNTLAQSLAAAGERTKAAEVAAEITRENRQIVAADMKSARNRDTLARGLRLESDLALSGNRPADALARIDEALAAYDGLTSETLATQADTLPSLHAFKARALARLGRHTAAQQELEVAARLLPPPASTVAATRYRDRSYWLAFAEVHQAAGDAAKAREGWEQYLLAFEPREGRRITIRSQIASAVALFHLGRRDEARALRDTARSKGFQGADILNLMPD